MNFLIAYLGFVILGSFSARFFGSYACLFNLFYLIGVPIIVFKKNPEKLGFRNYKKGFTYAVITSVLILPIYALISFKLNGIRYPKQILDDAVFYLFYVAIPEETFFRGFAYLFIERKPIFWILTKANLTSSFLFALAHVIIYRNLIMFKVFFPSLLFCYLYEKSDSIAAPITFHYLCDMVYLFF